MAYIRSLSFYRRREVVSFIIGRAHLEFPFTSRFCRNFDVRFMTLFILPLNRTSAIDF